jgi:glycosyltransferase involved in cell wall biosynthesis
MLPKTHSAARKPLVNHVRTPYRHDEKINEVRVSYIIATKNRAEYLDRTLQNVREFIDPSDELIIIDGASTDGTHEVIERNRDIVTQFVSEPDCGEGHAFNKGLFRSRGRYIKAITDDDYLYPDAMRHLVETMENHQEIEVIQCGGEVWGIENGRPYFKDYWFLPESERNAVSIFDYALSGLGLIVRRSAIEKSGGIGNNYVSSVDGDFLCRMIECRCSIGYLDIDLFRVFYRPHSYMNVRTTDVIHEDRMMIDIRLKRWDRVLDICSLDRVLTERMVRMGSISDKKKALILLMIRSYFIIFRIYSGLLAIGRFLASTRSENSILLNSESHRWTGRLINLN